MATTTARSLVVAGLGATLLATSVAVAEPASARLILNPGGIGAPAWVALEGMGTDSGPLGSPLDVFEIASNHRVVRWRIEGTLTTEHEDLGGYATGGVGAAKTTSGEIVFVRGGNGAVWYKEGYPGYGGHSSWRGWHSLGGRILGHPSAATAWDGATNSLVVVVRGFDSALYQRVRTAAGWSTAWQRVGGVLSSSPSIGATDAGLIVHVLGRDHQMWSATRGPGPDGQWSGWQRTILRDRSGRTIQPGFEATVDKEYGHLVVRVVDVNGKPWTARLGSTLAVGGYGQFISPMFAAQQIDARDPWFNAGFGMGRGLNGCLYYESTAYPGTRGWIPIGAQ